MLIKAWDRTKYLFYVCPHFVQLSIMTDRLGLHIQVYALFVSVNQEAQNHAEHLSCSVSATGSRGLRRSLPHKSDMQKISGKSR